MQVTVEGPGLRALDLLIEGLGRIQRPDFRQALLKNLGEESRALLRREFAAAQDPYGNRWKPLAKPRIRNDKASGGRERGKPLNDTGRLRNSFAYRVQGDTLRVGTNVIYAPVHQFGAVIRPVRAKALHWVDIHGHQFRKQVYIPARPFLPLQSKGLGDTWSAAFQRIAGRMIRRELTRR